MDKYFSNVFSSVFWLYLCGFMCSCFENEEARNVTRCRNEPYDTWLCPLDHVINVTSVYAGIRNQSGSCTISPSDCAAEVSRDVYHGEWNEILEKCNGRSACRSQLFPININLMCDGNSLNTDYMIIEYTCIHPPDFEGLQLHSHTLCDGNSFHSSLCPLGARIEVFDLYFTLHQNSSTECTPYAGDCVYASDYTQWRDTIAASCTGRLACENRVGIRPRTYVCGDTAKLAYSMVVQYFCMDAAYGDARYVRVPVLTIQHTALCPVGRHITTREAYLIASTADTSQDLDPLPSTCIKPYVNQQIPNGCDNRIACNNIRLAREQIRCPNPRSQPWGDHVIIVYTCDMDADTDPIKSALTCAGFPQSTPLQCPDNSILIDNIYVGYEANNTCDNDTDYNIGDCVKELRPFVTTNTYNSLLASCNGVDICEPQLPAVGRTMCNTVLYPTNNYYLFSYQCEKVLRTSITCAGNHINASCSTENAINIESITYKILATPELVGEECLLAIEELEAEFVCGDEIHEGSSYHDSVRDACENRQKCEPLLVYSDDSYCAQVSENLTKFLEIKYFCTKQDIFDFTTAGTVEVTDDITTLPGRNDTNSSRSALDSGIPIWLYIVVALVIIVLLVITIVVAIFLVRRNRRKREVPTTEMNGSQTPEGRANRHVQTFNAVKYTKRDTNMNTDNSQRVTGNGSPRMTESRHVLNTDGTDENKLKESKSEVPIATQSNDASMYANYNADGLHSQTGTDVQRFGNPTANFPIYEMAGSSKDGGYSVVQKNRLSDDDCTVIVDNILYSSVT